MLKVEKAKKSNQICIDLIGLMKNAINDSNHELYFELWEVYIKMSKITSKLFDEILEENSCKTGE